MRGDELVRLAMERLDAEGPTELADKLGLEGRTAPRRVSRWLTGENDPDYAATLLLLRAVGLLRDEADTDVTPLRVIDGDARAEDLKLLAEIRAGISQAAEALAHLSLGAGF